MMKLLLVMVFVYSDEVGWWWRDGVGERFKTELVGADVLGGEGGWIGFVEAGGIREGEDSLMMIIVGHRRIGTTSCLIGQN